MNWPDRITSENIKEVYREFQKEPRYMLNQHRPMQTISALGSDKVYHIPAGNVEITMRTKEYEALYVGTLNLGYTLQWLRMLGDE